MSHITHFTCIMCCSWTVYTYRLQRIRFMGFFFVWQAAKEVHSYDEQFLLFPFSFYYFNLNGRQNNYFYKLNFHNEFNVKKLYLRNQKKKDFYNVKSAFWRLSFYETHKFIFKLIEIMKWLLIHNCFAACVHEITISNKESNGI